MILIRADASTALGTGHAMRCLALAQALRDRGSSVALAAAAMPPGIADRYRAERAEIVSLAVETGSAADAATTAGVAARLGAKWLVVDGYSFDDAYVGAVAGEARVLLVDDWPREVASPSMVLNQNAYATPSDYPVMRPDRLLLGPSHALLRREYATAAPPDRRRATVDGPDRILVTLGGADPDNVTARVVDALAGRAERQPGVVGEVHVVIGAAHPAADALERRVTDAGFEPLRDVHDMLAEEDWADIAIGAAGTTSLELASRGLPTIHTVLMDNQVRVADEMARRGVAISAGPPDPAFEARLVAALDTLRDGARRATMSEAGRGLVDGRGAGRVAARLLEERVD